VVDASEFFAELDTDKNGSVSLDEFIAGCRKKEPILKCIESCLLSVVEGPLNVVF